MWTIICKECDIECDCVRNLNMILRNEFSMITKLGQTFSLKLSRIHVLLDNIHHHINVVVHISRKICKKTGCEVK
jgi:hypothetical protein